MYSARWEGERRSANVPTIRKKFIDDGFSIAADELQNQGEVELSNLKKLRQSSPLCDDRRTMFCFLSFTWKTRIRNTRRYLVMVIIKLSILGIEFNGNLPITVFAWALFRIRTFDTLPFVPRCRRRMAKYIKTPRREGKETKLSQHHYVGLTAFCTFFIN